MAFVFIFSLPDIWSTINHTATKTEITQAKNPQILKDDIFKLRNETLKEYGDSLIYQGNNIMNNPDLNKDVKKAIFDVRSMDGLYKKYTDESFSLNNFVREKERIMWFKNISRPFLLIIFGLIAYMVHLANKKRRRSLKTN